MLATARGAQNETERLALIQFFEDFGGRSWGNAYSRIISQGGYPWNIHNSTSNYCDWAGVICSDGPNFQVIDIYLKNFNASGSFSNSFNRTIAKFSSLQVLVMSENLIGGSLPDQLGSMKLLANFDISSNIIQGTIPSTISQMSGLQDLFLDHNLFGGTIPDFPPNLVNLNLESNLLTGGLDVSWPLQTLKFVNVASNRLKGTFPEALTNATELLTLILAENHLNGTIPDSFSHLTSLQIFDISQNEFTGDPPFTPLVFCPLMIYDISRNQFTGDYMNLFIARENALPPSCTLTIPFLASMNLNNNNFSKVSGDLLLKSIINLLFEYKPILSLDVDALDITPSNFRLGWPEYPHVTKGDRARAFPPFPYQCYEILYSGSGLTSTVFLPDTFWNYSNCECLPNFWGRPPICYPCPDSLSCQADRMRLTGGMFPVLDEKNISGRGVGFLLGLLPCSVANNTSPCKPIDLVFGDFDFEKQICMKGYAGRLCRECHCDEHHCYFSSGNFCVECKPTQQWIIITGSVAMVACLLAFIILKKGSGILFIMESVIVVLLLFLGIGSSYVFDVIIFLIIIQALDALSSENEEDDHDHHDDHDHDGHHHGSAKYKKIASIEGLAKLFLWYLQASGLLISEEFWPPNTKDILASINIVNFHASSIYCIEVIRYVAQNIGTEATKLLVVLIVPFLLGIMMVLTITLRRIFSRLREYLVKACAPSFECCSSEDTQQRHRSSRLIDAMEEDDLLDSDEFNRKMLLNQEDSDDLSGSRLLNERIAQLEEKQNVPFRYETASMILFVSYATFTEVSSTVFEMLSCEEDPFTRERFMSESPAVPCHGHEYDLISKIAWPAFVVWVLGLPFFYGFVLFINRKKLHEHNTESWLGLLYENYKKEFWWWEMIWIGRRILLALAQGFFRESGWGDIIICSLLIGSICVMFAFEPFKYRLENILEVLVTALLMTTWIASRGRQEGSASIQWTVIAFNGLLVLVFAVLFAFEPIKSCRRKYCEKKK